MRRRSVSGVKAVRPFAEIFALAAERKGGAAALEQILAKTSSRTPAEIVTGTLDHIRASPARMMERAGHWE